MAYSRERVPACPVGGDPMVKSLGYLPNVTASISIPVYVDKPHQKLVAARYTVLEAIDGTATCTIDIEKGAAGGTEVGTVTIAKSAAAGTTGDFTMASVADRSNLLYTDYFTIEKEASAAGTGLIKVDLIFEPAY